MREETPKKKLLRQEWLHISLLVVAFSVVGFLLYSNQHNKVTGLVAERDEARSTAASQTDQITDLESSIAGLTKKNTELQTQVEAYQSRYGTGLSIPQAKYLLTLDGAKQYAPRAIIADPALNTLLIIEITIKNTGNAPGYIGPEDFVLRDDKDATQTGGYSKYAFSPHPTGLISQEVQEGDTVRASIAYMVSTNQEHFVLKYNGGSYPVSVDGISTAPNNMLCQLSETPSQNYWDGCQYKSPFAR